MAGDRIVAVGGADELRTAGDGETRIIDGRGRVLLPAFIDSHTHFQRAAVARRFYADLDEARATSIANVLTTVRERAAALSRGSWVQVENLVPGRLAERRVPHRRELDAAAPEHPVVLRGIGRHLVVANSAALAAAGITRETPDPPAGRIGRDEDGEPDGALHEAGKGRLDMTAKDTVVPRPSVDERLDALEAAVAELHAFGIVGVHEMVRDPVESGDWLRLREQGRLHARVRFFVRSVESQTQLEHLLRLGLRTGFGDEWIRLGGVKFSIDGWEVLGGAALDEPYPEDPDNRGIIRIPQDVLEAEMRAADANGLQIAVHAAGPRAVDLALDAYEAVLGRESRGSAGNPLRHRIEHVCLPGRPSQLERIAELGLLWSTQPSFIEASGDLWRDLFDDGLLARAVPLRSALRLGIPVQANSDFPCSPMNPWAGIRAAVTRRTRAGLTLGRDEAVDVDDAIAMYTTAAAHSAFDDDRAACIAPGHRADLVVLDDDPFAVPVDELDRVRVGVTVVGGAVVFDRDE